jgi:putative FmdB family regulatory protein
MPTYDYECKTCNRVFEVFQSIKAEPLSRCPKCGNPVSSSSNMGTGKPDASGAEGKTEAVASAGKSGDSGNSGNSGGDGSKKEGSAAAQSSGKSSNKSSD